MKIDFVKAKKIAIYGLAALGALLVVKTGAGFLLPSSVRYSQVGMSESYSEPGLFSKGMDLITNAFSPEYMAEQGSGLVDSEEGLVERKIIKNGSLGILVKDAEETAYDVQTIGEDLDGFVESSQIYEVSVGTKAARVRIRVPSGKFEEAMTRIKELAVKVESENESTSDVTERFVDLEARLKSGKAEEEQYLKIMDRADTVEEVLNVTSRLSAVRSRIEVIEGQLKYLESQVDMSVIDVTLTAEAEIEVFGIQWRPLYIVKKAFRSMLEGLTGYVDAVIGFVFVLPIMALWGISIFALAFIGWRILRWLMARFGS